MSPTLGLPPPDAEDCLVAGRWSRSKGGTVINEDVRDLDEHSQRICRPDGYRPSWCPRCEGGVLHVHSYVERRPLAEAGVTVVRIIKYLCTGCRATWRILPMFLARHLWRTWSTVERTVKPQDTPAPQKLPPVAEQTRRRWVRRLLTSARTVVALLELSQQTPLQQVASSVGNNATRAALVDAYAEQMAVAPGKRLAELAALTHRLERGVRLM